MFKASDFKGKKACVLGLGKSGVAAAKLLAKKGFKVLVSEAKNADAGKFNLGKNVEIETNGHTDKIFDCAFIVKSPGMPGHAPVLLKAKRKGIKIFSETEVAVSFIPKSAKIIAITGTNGKTTTTMLTAAVFRQHCKDKKNGKKVFMAGNVGDPLSNYADKIKSGDYVVAELSSYQLEDSIFFKPRAAAVLNITPDHIDHHGSFERYMAAKKKIFKFQNSSDFAIINGADENCLGITKRIKSKVMCFATTPQHKARAHVFYDGDELVFSSGTALKPPKLLGIHNVENAMAAALLAIVMGVGAASIQRAFNNFKGVTHRIEEFLVYKGIRCIDDSKATNVESTVIALRAMPDEQNIWLILGGRDKGMPYDILGPLIEKKCRGVLTVGEASPKIRADLSFYPDIFDCGIIDNAVKYVFENGAAGDILLLSPACASFDQFKNFEERGKYFKKVCRALAGAEENCAAVK
ncbi:MAG: UDP-N-acetylmuramoyl-L-alanine--D-glutamate ligase [Elusimicrobium sp.]|jgi:UDP-N-acetylmuramoylalanine--D-glutamate ligase|nr:UDP-N-acetylmuramoyl-L-alanine--D-glutamate ligase [Elusimicrobium sp.]